MDPRAPRMGGGAVRFIVVAGSLAESSNPGGTVGSSSTHVVVQDAQRRGRQGARHATRVPQECARSRVRGVEHADDETQNACRDAPRSSAKTHVMKSARCTTTYADPWSGAPLASILHEHPGRGTLASSRRCESV